MSQFLPSSPQLMMIAGIGILIWVLWRRSNKHFGRGGKAYETPHRLSKIEPDRDLALCDAPPEVTRWQVEMHELVREFKGEVDTKFAVLQLLTIQANEATARLEKLIERAQRMGLDRHSDPLAAIEQGTYEVTSDFESPKHPEAARIYALADRGESATAIADQTGLSLGDVEMTLSLRQLS